MVFTVSIVSPSASSFVFAKLALPVHNRSFVDRKSVLLFKSCLPSAASLQKSLIIGLIKRIADS